MAISDYVNRVPTWGWAAGGVILIGLVFLMTRSGGQSAISPAVPAADVNDILAQLQNAADQLGSQTPTNPTTPTTPTSPTTSGAQRLSLTGKTAFYDPTGKTVIGYLKSGTFDVKKVRINGKTYWQIISKQGTKWYKTLIHAVSNPTYKILPPLPSPTTTSTTAALPTSNNQVSS